VPSDASVDSVDASVVSVASDDVAPSEPSSSLVHAAPSSASATSGTSARRVDLLIGSPIRLVDPDDAVVHLTMT
jgi:hypothetical protein